MLAATEPGIRELHGALIAGADDYLMKPFTSLQIDEKLAQVGLASRSMSIAPETTIQRAVLNRLGTPLPRDPRRPI